MTAMFSIHAGINRLKHSNQLPTRGHFPAELQKRSIPRLSVVPAGPRRRTITTSLHGPNDRNDGVGLETGFSRATLERNPLLDVEAFTLALLP